MNATDLSQKWYVMSATFNRSFKVQEHLEDIGVESFIPLRTKVCTIMGKKIRKEVPAISNLIFIRTTEDVLKNIKQRISYLHYGVVKAGKEVRKMTVKDEEMNLFIRYCTQTSQEVTYLSPDEIHLAKGTRVRIHGGPLDGLEGHFIKVKGVRKKCVVMKIDNIAAAALIDVHPDLLEVIP